MGSKRKHHYHSNSRTRHSNDHNHTSSPGDAKRRRLSTEMSESHETISPAQGNGHVSREPHQEEDEGWTKVSSKSAKRGHKTKDKQGRDRDDYPALRIYQNYQSDIRLKDLRDLSLYVLADEIAPKWTAIANSRRVRKVVAVMVPGLDQSLLRTVEMRTGKKWKLDQAAGIGAKDQNVVSNDEQGREPSELIQQKDNTTEHTVPQGWLFNNVLHVKGPGDAKMNKVHSPLQAMLLSQDANQKKTSSNLHGNGYTSELTPITEFIHTADELREAEFPVHPASFTATVDAELEATRRTKTGQSLEAGWVDTKVTESQPKMDAGAADPISKGLAIYSLDCEMVQTENDVTSLARISLISYPDGKVIIDKYVKPDLPITNYFTQYSGITPQLLEHVTTSLKDIQQELLDILTPSSVLLGHSLDSDLNALKLTHPFVVDTSLVYPHPRGLPLRSSLKYLANKYLKREIQTGGANGHNSVEDAQAVLDLVKLKCEKGPKWGTIEANGEPIFRRLKRNGRTSAMIDYGTPERGFGKDATHTLGCQNDDEIVKNVTRAVKGDDFFDFEIPAGGVDFIWARLRALEYARGWVSSVPASPKDDATTDEKETKDDQEKLDTLAIETVARIQQIYDVLPSRSLLIVFSGTGDMRPVLRLQALQQQYKKEFKVKKWDELTVKWTDTEEQALRKACDDARAGWAVCTIK